jgi:flavin-dependent dehydrogenase
LCAQEAGRTAAEAVEDSDYSSDFLQRYQRVWRSSFGGEFTSMIAARRLLNKLPDGRIDGIFKALKGEGLEEVLRDLVEAGDMDMQSDVIRSALRDPGVRGVLVRGVGRFALGELKRLFNI